MVFCLIFSEVCILGTLNGVRGVFRLANNNFNKNKESVSSRQQYPHVPYLIFSEIADRAGENGFSADGYG